MSKITSFFHEVGSEMRKTSWPKGKELTKYTLVVVVTVVLFALYFLLIDTGISEALRWFLAL